MSEIIWVVVGDYQEKRVPMKKAPGIPGESYPSKFVVPRRFPKDGERKEPSEVMVLEQKGLEPLVRLEDRLTYQCSWPYPHEMCCGRLTAFRKSYCAEHIARSKK